MNYLLAKIYIDVIDSLSLTHLYCGATDTMTPNETLPKPQHMQSHRSGASRKLLSRKADDRAMAAQGEALEDVFPAARQTADDEPAVSSSSAKVTGLADGAAPTDTAGEPALDAAPAPDSTSPPQAAAEPLQTQAEMPTWSDDDERVFAAMAVRRKASGFQRRGKNVGGQLLRPGSIVPNPGTVVATIVALVASRGTVTRAELLKAMAVAEFGNAKSRPRDTSWCNGYVAGSVRDGFLQVVIEHGEIETSPVVTL
jgi:hypothetical protein